MVTKQNRILLKVVLLLVILLPYFFIGYQYFNSKISKSSGEKNNSTSQSLYPETRGLHLRTDESMTYLLKEADIIAFPTNREERQKVTPIVDGYKIVNLKGESTYEKTFNLSSRDKISLKCVIPKEYKVNNVGVCDVLYNDNKFADTRVDYVNTYADVRIKVYDNLKSKNTYIQLVKLEGFWSDDFYYLYKVKDSAPVNLKFELKGKMLDYAFGRNNSLYSKENEEYFITDETNQAYSPLVLRRVWNPEKDNILKLKQIELDLIQ